MRTSSPQAIDAATLIFNVKGGWVEGPRIKGKLVAPAADWLQILPSGAWRLDVRGTMVTDDEQMIFVSYNGIISFPEATGAKLASGSAITHADVDYFVTAPTFRTASEKYLRPNQCASCRQNGPVVDRSSKHVGQIRHLRGPLNAIWRSAASLLNSLHFSKRSRSGTETCVHFGKGLARLRASPRHRHRPANVGRQHRHTWDRVRQGAPDRPSRSAAIMVTPNRRTGQG